MNDLILQPVILMGLLSFVMMLWMYATRIPASKEIEKKRLPFSIKKYKKKDDFEKAIRETRKKMEKAAKELDFLKAASLRDEIKFLQTKKKKL